MIEYLFYILKVSMVQSVFYLFYLGFFKERTSLMYQRIFLITSLVISFFIPFIRLTAMGESINIPSGLLKFNEALNLQFAEKMDTPPEHSSGIPWTMLLGMIYFTGIMIFVYRFLASVLSLVHIIRQGTVHRYNQFRLVSSDKAISPFSFFHFIVINEDSCSEAELKQIITHESAHINQLHTLDMILIESIRVLAWFNPFLSHIKRSIKAVHEYIADRHAIESGTDPLEYQLLLIRQNFKHKVHSLTSNLNVSLIKKRIMMLSNYQKTKSVNCRYLLVIPLLVLMSMAFSYQNTASNKVMTGFSGQLQSENKPCISPVEGDKIKVTSGYGMRMHPIYKKTMMHSGIDLAAREGTPVVATANGIVKEIADEHYDPKGYGKFIVIIHDEIYTTMYAQLLEVLVKEQQSVKKGEIIGRVGKSGLSTAPHLHYEVWKNNEKVNPADYFH